MQDYTRFVSSFSFCPLITIFIRKVYVFCVQRRNQHIFILEVNVLIVLFCSFLKKFQLICDPETVMFVVEGFAKNS
jgi:hypothetical protein